ncbi:MAG: M20 family metallo-hydrolase, partial [Chitinophagaceae bacterium]
MKAQQKLYNWMKDAGLVTNIDNIGNVRGKLMSKKRHAKTFIIGSHFDTVINAGKFDGPLGILAGLDIIERLIEDKVELPFHLELVAFSDEEGVRFHTSYLGSRVLTGAFDYELLQKKDTDGITLNEVINDLGANAKQITDDAIPISDWLGYFEIHIEQGPVLDDSKEPVAIVTSIAGQKRSAVIFTGVAGHAGTVPMNMRQDALCATAEFISKVENFAKQKHSEIVATVGKLEISNAASNVIPGEVTCTVDLRSGNANRLNDAALAIGQLAKEIAAQRNVQLTWKTIQENAPVDCDEKLMSILAETIASTGFNTIRLVSGAGHDAVPISEVAPVAMLFVRCYKGISHNPMEDVEIKDIAAALQVAENFIKGLALKL